MEKNIDPNSVTKKIDKKEKEKLHLLEKRK